MERNLIVSIKESLNTFFYFIGSMFDILKQLFTGKVGVGQLSGPIGVVGAISSAASNGLYSLLYITAFLSVNLGIKINLRIKKARDLKKSRAWYALKLILPKNKRKQARA